MSTLLCVWAHPLTEEESRSLTIAAAFLDAYKKAHPEDQITILNLFDIRIPPINAVTFSAWGKLRKGAALPELSPEEREAAGKHTELADQFVAADKYVFVNPMWNHFLPPELKAYLDTLCVAGKTFQYTPQGPIGLLSGKKALHIQAAGGVYNRESPVLKDFGHAYLAHIMEFFGISEVEGLFIEGCDAQPGQAPVIMENAEARALQMVELF